MTTPAPRLSELDPNFREPRTAAEMIPARLALIDALGEQRCHSCKQPLTARDPSKQTYEQIWCGVWLDCTNRECATVCTMWDGPELAHWHGRPYTADGSTWQKYTPAGWTVISASDVAAYFASIVAWQEARIPGSARPRRRKRAAWQCRRCSRAAEFREGWHHLATAAGIKADASHQVEPKQRAA